MIYHKDIGFPSTYRRPLGSMVLTPSNHALEASVTRGIVIPERINFNNPSLQVIEVGFEGSRMNHLLVRIPYDNWDDLVMALGRSDSHPRWIIKATWKNEWTDIHDTLDATEYATP